MTRRRRTLRRLGALAPAASAPRRVILGWIGRRVPTRSRERLVRMTGPGGPVEAIAGAKVCLGALSAGIGVPLGGGGTRAVLAAGTLAIAGWRLPEILHDRRIRSRSRAILASLPDTLDLLAACARAGASVGRAFALAASRDDGPLGDAMRDAVRALDHGLARDHAYRILSERAGVPEVHSLVASLRRAERLGTSVATTLTELAADMRERRRTRAEEEARAAPVRMLIPVFVCFLPAFGLLTVVPVIIVALRGFRGV